MVSRELAGKSIKKVVINLALTKAHSHFDFGNRSERQECFSFSR